MVALEQLEKWQRELMRLVSEMEKAYGPPGDNNQDVLDSAVHVAFHVACGEVANARRLAKERIV